MWGAGLVSGAARDRCVARLQRLPVVWPEPGPGEPPRRAAVLVPVCVEGGAGEERVSLLYTRRSPALNRNSGQISFPGGMAEEGETPEQTALRESEEELGLPPARVQVWGRGPSVPGRAGDLRVVPVVGLVRDYRPDELRPSELEVESVFTVPVEHLCHPDNHGYTEFHRPYRFSLPVFVYRDRKIWGITALMTHMFLTCFVPKEQYSNDLSRNKMDPDDLIKLSKL